jgi:hypothetical protein
MYRTLCEKRYITTFSPEPGVPPVRKKSVKLIPLYLRLQTDREHFQKKIFLNPQHRSKRVCQEKEGQEGSGEKRKRERGGELFFLFPWKGESPLNLQTVPVYSTSHIG